MGEGGWDFFSSKEFFFTSTASAGFFSRGQVPCTKVFFGGGIFYSRNLNLDTRHKQIAWNRFQTNNFLSFTQSFCSTVKIILRGKYNQVSDTLFKYHYLTDRAALHFLFDVKGNINFICLFGSLVVTFILGIQ